MAVAMLNELLSVSCTTLMVHVTCETCISTPSPTSTRTRTVFVPTPMYSDTSTVLVLPAATFCVSVFVFAPCVTVTVTRPGFPVLSPVVVSVWSYLYVSFTSSPTFTVLLGVMRVSWTFVVATVPPPPPVNTSLVLMTSPDSFSRESE